MFSNLKRFTGSFMLFAMGGLNAAWAGSFTMAHFVPPGDFSLGIEPELTLSHGAGLAFNAKYTHGLGELTNLTGIIGTGGGPRQFRLGGLMTFDFFPDEGGNQLGVGLATQMIYYRQKEHNRFEITGAPYLHKTFASGGDEFEPFVAVPLGFAFSNGSYQTTATLSLGSMFKLNERFRTVLELGVAIKNAETYLAGGIAYYH